MPFLHRIMALVLLLAPIIAAPAGAQAQERRFALVIGNTEYKAGRLPTAANDAGLIAETLRTAGFDVAGARDLDQDTLRRSLRDFLDKVSAAGPEAVSVIYIAGYGLQYEGENYIVPIDATVARDDDIPIDAIRISDFTRPLSGTPGAVKLVIIDAAREHPFTPAGPPLASGLALVDPDPGMLIAFNTAPGSVAPIENGPYGAFAQALSEMIAAGGLGLDDVFSRVRLRVNETTGGVAVPWYASKVAQPFLFTEPTANAPQQQAQSVMQVQSESIQQYRDDRQAYIAALERDTIAGYEEFLAAYPDSPQARRVRALIAVRREALMWRRALSINTTEAYWSYLDRYPQGAHVADAERLLARLNADYDPPPAFVPMAFADIPPPPPDEVVYLNQPVVVFDDPVFVPPPPVPAFFCPPRPREFVALLPPPPPAGAFFLPAPVVPVFTGPRPWVRPPAVVVVPPPPPVQRIIINNTTIINQRPAGVGLMSPALPGAVVTRVNTGVLHAPPPAPKAVVPALHNVSLQRPAGSVLGTQATMPPRVHAATAPAGSRPLVLPGPGATQVPTTPGVTPAPGQSGGVRPPVQHELVRPEPGQPGGVRPPVPHELVRPEPGQPGGVHPPMQHEVIRPEPGQPGGVHPPMQHEVIRPEPGQPGGLRPPVQHEVIRPEPGQPGGLRPPVQHEVIRPEPGQPGGVRPPVQHELVRPEPGQPGGVRPPVQHEVVRPEPVQPGGLHPPVQHELVRPEPGQPGGVHPPMQHEVIRPEPGTHAAPPPHPAPAMHNALPAPHVETAKPPPAPIHEPPAPHPGPRPPEAMIHNAPPPPRPAAHAPPPPGGKKCVVENGREVCR